jgi:outer membrane protein OmpA-like peptidoglycan-associated protein
MKNIISLRVKSIIAIVLAVTFMVSCNTTRTTRGGAIGAGAGGVVGGIIGARTGSTAAGAIIGATVGGAAGAVIGRYMDNQAQELDNELENATVERVGEGIKVTFDSGILFGFDSDQLTGEALQNVNQMAEVLKKYEDTEILIEGHTDNVGRAQYNQRLSERRAAAVARQLQAQGVPNARVSTKGYGLEQPVASNETEEGRAQNRRVEVAIWANEELQRKAEQGEVSVR